MTETVWGDRLAPINLIIHLVTSILLLGSLTHHLVQIVKGNGFRGQKPLRRYSFWTTVSYVVCFAWGVVIYPSYAYHVRFLYSDANVPWATGLFEIKEHCLAIGLAMLPFYYSASHSITTLDTRQRRLYVLSVWTLTGIVWYSFIVGGILVNVRGI